MNKRGRPPKIGAVRNKSGRIKYSKPDVEPQKGGTWSREYQWLRDNLSPQALEAARWYAEWVKHRNYWLGYDEWRLPGDDLTVSTRLGRKSFTALVKVPGSYESKRPGLSNDGVEPDDRGAVVLAPSTPLPLIGQVASVGRPSAAEAAAAALQDDGAARLQQRRYKTQIEYYDSGLVVRRIPEGERGENVVYGKKHAKAGQPYKFGAKEMMGRPEDGPFPPRKPNKPAYAPPPTDTDKPCPGCSCNMAGTCEFRERIRSDNMALKMILQERIAPVDDLSVPLSNREIPKEQREKGREHIKWEGIPKVQRYSAGKNWEDQPPAVRKADKRRRTGDVRRKRWLLDHFALDGQYPAPDEIAPLEEILMKMHQFFRDAPSRADWDDSYDPQAKPLTVAERMVLYAKQSPQATAHEVILHVAKTEGYDLKYLGRVQSASQAAAAGGDLYKKAS